LIDNNLEALELAKEYYHFWCKLLTLCDFW